MVLHCEHTVEPDGLSVSPISISSVVLMKENRSKLIH